MATASSMPFESDRRLATFVDYEPHTSVMDYAAIELDIRTIEARLALKTLTGDNEARQVYLNGAYSKPYARLTLNSALSVDSINAGEEVRGTNAEGNQVKGTVMEDAKEGDDKILVLYHVPSYEDTKNGCFVGGNPQPITKGCFAETGSISVGKQKSSPLSLSYKYDVLQNNENDHTLAKFSTKAEQEMYECIDNRCRRPYETYKKFYDYYKIFDYANNWVMAAFSNSDTTFVRGEADFSLYKDDGRAVAVENGISYLNVWMYVIRKMEHAIDHCYIDSDDDALHSWDGAVALYTGFLHQSPGSDGYLLYTLAETQCQKYGTCKNGVNYKIYNLFNKGKVYLLNTSCDKMKKVIEEITQLMTVPLVQGMLSDAYSLDHYKDSREWVEASGATFAAALLPLLHNCSAPIASQIYNNIKVGNDGSGSYEVIKDAVEKQYQCLGITCEDVGGILDLSSKGYRKNAQPCGISQKTSTVSTASMTTSKSNSHSGPIIGIVVGCGIVLAVVVAFLVWRARSRKSMIETISKPASDEDEDAEASTLPEIVYPDVDDDEEPPSPPPIV